MFKKYYKYTRFDKETLQESRRRALLEEQKRQRALLHDGHRSNQIIDIYCPEEIPHKDAKKQYKHKYTLQQSEWFHEQPSDLGEWFLVPCPKGQRCLVIASGKRTDIYSKNGRLFHQFNSLLPGSDTSSKGVTILDCIYVKDQHTFYVLDALAYGSHDLQLCEAEFRFFWLRCRFAENNFEQRSTQNEESFQLLDHFDLADMNSMTALLRYPYWPNNYPALDGFLFYHKESSYIGGLTPLVCWLFPFMVPDVLGLKVNAEYVPPEDYCNPQQYIEKFNNERKSTKRHQSRRQKLDKSLESMDVEFEKRNYSDTANQIEEDTNDSDLTGTNELYIQ